MQGDTRTGEPEGTPCRGCSMLLQDGSWPNSTTPAGEERSPCVVGIIPIVYYSVLLALGLPANVLTAAALSRLAARTKKSSYWHLLALTASDILAQVLIVFVGFILQTGILGRAMPAAAVHAVTALEFAASHASVWVAVLLAVDRYVALCHPLRHRVLCHPARSRRLIAAVFTVALATGVPFYWWLDVWRDADPPTALDRALKWLHCVAIYFLPCGIFLATNSAITCQLRRAPGPRRGRDRASALLLAVTSVFALLWAPRTAVMLCHLYVASVRRDWRVHLALDVANMVAMLNTALNGLLYCCVSRTFRHAVAEVLRSSRPLCAAGHASRQPARQGGSPPPPSLKMLGLLRGTPL
ncbi:putative G-protein coupled receptor 142 [Alligator mississippiensis]|uniref:G-protein coupled receptor 142 n=1 Tax=Alligator mississippiensis TaxID=8496 RepID=A0A151MZH2_ALLMI|nr:putative G-protein coupled receptor 142 [Alligator mississippiensis]